MPWTLQKEDFVQQTNWRVYPCSSVSTAEMWVCCIEIGCVVYQMLYRLTAPQWLEGTVFLCWWNKGFRTSVCPHESSLIL